MLIKAVDEQPAIVVRRRIHRAARRREPARAQPCLRGAQQSARDVGIVDRLEESEKAHAIVMEGIVGAILDGRDTADRFPVAPRDEEFSVGLPIERVALGVE